jgi:hypothetical protein
MIERLLCALFGHKYVGKKKGASGRMCRVWVRK